MKLWGKIMSSEKSTLQDYLHFEQFDVKHFEKEKSYGDTIEIPVSSNFSGLSLLALKSYFVQNFIQNDLLPEDMIILNHIYKSEMIIISKNYYVHISFDELLEDLISKGYEWTEYKLYQRMTALLMVIIGMNINGNDNSENNQSYNVSLLYFDYNSIPCSDDSQKSPGMLIKLSNDILETFIYKQSELAKLPIIKQIELTASEEKTYEPIDAKEYIEFLNAIAKKANV
jgi:hypothetical protein